MRCPRGCQLLPVLPSWDDRPPTKSLAMSATTARPDSTKTTFTTYRAAVVNEFNAPLTVEQVARRELEVR